MHKPSPSFGFPTRLHRIALAVLVASAFGSVSIVAIACPYCPTTDPTLSTKLQDSDAACVVKFVSSKNGKELSQQTTRFEVVNPFPTRPKYKKGDRIEVPFGVTAKAGDLFLMIGQSKDDEMEWSLPIPMDELGSEYHYLVKAPPPESNSNRLEYFLEYLDSKIPVISNDAFAEFAQAKFEDVEALAPKISRTRIRALLLNPNPQLDVRRGFYGMMLGLCGNDDDARFLEQKIFAPIDPKKFRFGIDGMMGGYLLLRGQAGLDALIEKKIDAVPIDIKPEDPRIGDFNSVRATLNFAWDFRHKDFTEESMIGGMRKFLDRPQVAESAVVDLARWKDWKSLHKLISDYGRDPWDTRAGKEKVVAFALSCLKDERTASGKELAEYGEEAKKFIDGLDPQFVQWVRRLTASSTSAPAVAPVPAPVKPASSEQNCSDASDAQGSWKTNCLFVVVMSAFLFVIRVSI